MAPIFRQGFNMNDRMITWRQVVLCFQRLFQICSCVNMHYSHSSVLSKNIFLYEIPFTQVHLSLSLSLILSGVPQKDKSTVPSHYMYIVCCIIFVRSNKHLECISFVIKHVFSILNPKFFLHLRSWMFTSLQSSSSLPFDGALLQILAHYLHLLISWIVWNHWQECNGKPITHMHMHVRLCSHTNRDPLIKKIFFTWYCISMKWCLVMLMHLDLRISFLGTLKEEWTIFLCYIIGDMNAKMGPNNRKFEQTVGSHLFLEKKDK